MSRKTAREVAMKLSFASLFGGGDTYEEVLEKSGIEEQPAQDDIEYANKLVEGIRQSSDELDDLIGELAIGWEFSRMPRVDITILRIAIYEMLHMEDIPLSVSINEAVELAKAFGGDKSPSFINGLLGTLAKRIEDGAEQNV